LAMEALSSPNTTSAMGCARVRMSLLSISPASPALTMASLTPARAIGWAERKGSLEPGKDADIAVFNPDFASWRTMIGGRWVWAGDSAARQAARH